VGVVPSEMKSSPSSVFTAPSVQTLRITEIFYSIQGESDTVGWPTVFIRLTGCPLRCQYCDTAYAFSGGQLMSMDMILETVSTYSPLYVTVTGGEPLAQPACIPLLARLCHAGYRVSLETSGALNVSAVDPRVMKVVDIKTPGSQEEAKNRWSNLAYLMPQDQLKFVICSRSDYEWSRDQVLERRLHARCMVLFSPSYLQVSLRECAEWILADRLPVRLQTQLHKSIWGDEPGR
jgi:7-carboxy-7-deazaguanine synthase